MSRPTLAPLFALIAVTLFSMNDVMMKFLSGGYALHQLVLLRSCVGLVIVVGLMAPLSGGWHLLRTRRLGLHILRAICVIVANMAFFLGLAALPLADAVAIFFVSPFLISIFSVIFLGETVGPRRWMAIAIGMIGVLIVLQPGTSSFQLASLLPLIGATGYAGLHIFTRHLRDTENAVNMTFYIQVTFICLTVLLGVTIGDGKFDVFDQASMSFLLRAWEWPVGIDVPIIAMLGVFASVGGYFISQAYRLGEAALIAPFEYLALPLSILWGFLIFEQWPTGPALTGIGLILGSGLYTIWRERQIAKATS
ncbi:DMT family transporter [Algirhabdus cladophorae]|uniref:DMT family transporter n=1 Tax=Algirhabdus cladophorae TaxID=3377108 RepID=UPI003B847D04